LITFIFSGYKGTAHLAIYLLSPKGKADGQLDSFTKMFPQEHFKPMIVHSSSFFSPSDSKSATSDWQAGRRPKQKSGLFMAVVVAGLWVAATCDAGIEANAYITNNVSGTLSVINTETQTVVGQPITVGVQPFGVAATPDGRFVYVTNVVNGTVSVISADTNLISSTIPVGTRPFGIATSSDAQFAYVANSFDHTVSVINTATNTVVGSPIPVGNQPFGIAVTPNGSTVYVANDLGNSVSVIDTATKTVSATIPVGLAPQGLAITPNGQFVYVANFGSNTVSKISTASNTVVTVIPTTIDTGLGSLAITPDGQFVYVTDQNDGTVTVISTSTDTLVGAPITVGTHPFGVSATPNGQFVFVTNFGSNNVFVINTATNTVTTAPITVGTSPLSLGSFIGPNIIVAPGGPLVIANDAALTPLGFGTFVDFNGGTLQTSGSLITSRTISLLTLGGTIDTNGFNSTLAGRIINSGALTKIGTGTLTLSGNNSYSGGTNILGGVVSVTSDANLGTGNLAIGNNAELLTTGAGFVSGKAITLLGAGGGTLASASGLTATYGGVIGGIGPLNVGDGIASGTIILNGLNTYSGGTTINHAILQIAADTSLGAAAGGLTFNGGILQTTTSFSTARAVTLNGAGGTFEPNAATTFSIDGAINGIGGLTKNGGGTVVLSGINGYTGGTTVLAGTLQAGSASGFVNNTAYTVNGGTLDLNNFALTMSSLNGTGGTVNLGAAPLTINNTGLGGYSGVIQGTGSLTKMGAGTQTLSGSDTYTGGTTVLAGTLQAGSATGFVNNTAYTVNGGILDLNNLSLTVSSLNGTGGTVNLGTAPLTINNTGLGGYSGVIQGTGSLTKVGAGTQTLSGNDTYAGGTTVLAGTLQAGSASGFVNNTAYTVNGGILDLNNFSLTMASLNGTGGKVNLGTAPLTINNTGMDAYSGVIQGTGSLTKNGYGTLTLSGQNTFLGGTLVKAGTLVVNSAQALGLGNVVLQGGVLKSDPQPINVAGNYVQNGGGTLQLTLRGTAPGQYDTLNVAGHAALDGTLQLLFLQSFQPKIGDKLTLVLAAGGVSGQFASALNPFDSLIGLELVYQPDSVLLEFPSDFTAFARTPNQQAVAAQLDAVAFDPREAPLLAFLQNEPLGNLGADFEQLSPDSLSALYEISFSGANIQAANLENRFAEIRSGSTGFTSSLHLSNSPGTMVEGKDGKAVIEPSQNPLTPSPENKWGVWTSGSGDFVNVSSDGNGQGYNFTTGGVSLGLDYRLTGNLAVGIAAGYAHTWTNLTENGNIDVNSARGGLYAAFSENGFYLNGYAGGGYNSYNTRRNVLGGEASGSTNGGEFDGYAGGGYDFHCGGFAFGPLVSLEYTYVGISGYNESGSLAPLRIVSQNQDSLRSNVGLSALYTWKAGSVQLRPSLRASWQHEYFYSALPIEAQFASGAGSVFTVHGPAEGHNSALIDAGLDVQWTPTIGTYFGYDGQVGRTNYDSHAVLCSVHLDF
jgi:YVTN family beta-propeller protein/autotransporter-associated beta strand protein